MGFKYNGVSHIALVCDDMAKTMEFYRDTLELPFVGAMELPFGGQHFFFDIGNGDMLAFMWYSDDSVRPAAPGVAAPAFGGRVGQRLDEPPRPTDRS